MHTIATESSLSTLFATAHYRRQVGQITILSGLLALACNVLLGLAVRFNFETFSNPALLFDGLEWSQTTLFRWGMLTDLWGYYLLLVPAVLLLCDQVTSLWQRVYLCAGLAYTAFGAVGAAVLASTGTDLLQYALHATGDARADLHNQFLLVYSLVNNSIWNLLEMGLFGIFLLGVAPGVRSQHGRPQYWLTLVLGYAGLLDAVGHTFEVAWLAELGLNVYLALAPVWAVWLGVRWVRGR